jgi:NAD(P)H-hydrate repair Nnr-like enzyme with NAD(P)H-hydrate dehydratase domain
MARLLGTGTDQVLARHFEVGCEVARRLGVAVLMKGVPTVISSPDGAQRLVSATGNPVLAAAGSGDLLAGIAVTMLAQCGDPTMAGALAAFAHGRAAELATDRVARLGAFGSIAPAGDRWRGVTLDDVERALAWAWRLPANEQIDQVLIELPAVR